MTPGQQTVRIRQDVIKTLTKQNCPEWTRTQWHKNYDMCLLYYYQNQTGALTVCTTLPYISCSILEDTVFFLSKVTQVQRTQLPPMKDDLPHVGRGSGCKSLVLLSRINTAPADQYGTSTVIQDEFTSRFHQLDSSQEHWCLC